MREGDAVALNKDVERWWIYEKGTEELFLRGFSRVKSGPQNKEYAGVFAIVNS